MKKLYIISIFLFMVTSLQGANITVDGDLSDWTNQVGLTNIVDPGGTGDDAQARSDIVSNGVAVDSSKIYFYFKLEGNYEDSARYEIYIDSDNNTNTGTNYTYSRSWSGGGDSGTNMGSNKGVELGIRYCPNEGGASHTTNYKFSWTSGSGWGKSAVTITGGKSGNIIEIPVSLSTLSLSQGDTIGVVFHSYYYWDNPPESDFNLGSTYKEIKFTIPLSAPQNVHAVAISNSRINLYWDEISGVTSYTIFRASSLSGPTNKIGGSTTASFQDSTVANAFSSDYYYWVKAYKGSASSPFSQSALNSQGYPVISVDGSLTEWTQQRCNIIIDSDQTNDYSASGTSYMDIITNMIANDDTYLYISWALVSYHQSITYECLIDSDNNSITGIANTYKNSRPVSDIGAEFVYIITNDTAIKFFTNNSGTWSFSSSGSIFAKLHSGNTFYELKIPLSELNLKYGDLIKVKFATVADWSGAIDENGIIKYSISGGTSLPAPAPANVSAFIQSDTSVYVSWQASSGATSYKVYRNTVNNSGSASLVASGVANTYYDDTSASSALSTKYYYWVVAVKSGASDSAFSSVAESKSYVTFDDFDSYTNNADLSNSWSVYGAWNANSTGEIYIDKNDLFESNSASFYVAPQQGVGNDEAVVMQKNLSFQNHSVVDSYILWTKNGVFPGDSYFYFGFNNYQWDSTDNATFTTFASNYIGMNYFKQLIISKSKITADTTFAGWNSVSKILLGIRETDTGGTINTSFYIDKIMGVGVSSNSLPIVSSVSPANDSTYAMSTTSVPVSFTIGSDMTNIIFQVITNNTFFTTYRQPTISYDGNVASMNINLPEGTNKIVIDAVNKINGLPLKQYVLTFNAVIPPSLKNLAPPNNSHQVATNTNIRFNITDNIQVESNLLFVEINSSTVLSNGSFLSGWDGANSSISRVGNITNYSVVIDKTVPYNNNTKYTLTIIAQDNNNNIITNISYFYTPDTINPYLLNFNPANGAVISPNGNIYFEANDNLAVNSNSIVVRIGTNIGSATNWTTTLTNGVFQSGYGGSIAADGSGGFDVTVNPDNDFTSGAKIYIDIAIADYGNNNISTNFYYDVQSDFTAPVTILSKPAGSYVGAFDLTLTVQDDSDYWLFYTVDGSDPLTSSAVISNNSSATISIIKNITLKYYSRDIYNNTETVKTAYYEILNIPSDSAEIYNNYCDLSKGEKVRFVLNKPDTGVVINVYNLKGNLVWSKNVENTGGRELIEWNGVDNNGNKVGGGVYIVYIKGDDIDIKRKIIIVK